MKTANTARRATPKDEWHPTALEDQVPPFSGVSWYVDRDTPLKYGALTAVKGNAKQSHLQLFRTKQERRRKAVPDEHTRFFRLKNAVKVVDGNWFVLRSETRALYAARSCPPRSDRQSRRSAT